jgi:hypothetical protein
MAGEASSRHAASCLQGSPEFQTSIEEAEKVPLNGESEIQSRAAPEYKLCRGKTPSILAQAPPPLCLSLHQKAIV